jgi:5-formyltetrahydrofolate cyclo-ligase
MIARRDALPPDKRSAAAEAIAAQRFALPIAAKTTASGFMPIKSEINPLPLMKRLAEAGTQLALPARPTADHAGLDLGRAACSGVWGIREPKPQASAVDPDICLVPLLAFDSAGRRLGYGGGYHDLTLSHFRSRKTVIAVGLAYAAQEIPHVPTAPRDVPLDLVLTERAVIDLR